MIRQADTINTPEKQAIVDAVMKWYTKGGDLYAIVEAAKAYQESQKHRGLFESEDRCCLGGPKGLGCCS